MDNKRFIDYCSICMEYLGISFVTDIRDIVHDLKTVYLFAFS